MGTLTGISGRDCDHEHHDDDDYSDDRDRQTAAFTATISIGKVASAAGGYFIRGRPMPPRLCERQVGLDPRFVRFIDSRRLAQLPFPFRVLGGEQMPAR